MVQSRISPGLTAVAFSRGTSADSRSTAAESCTFTSGRAALASIMCRWAKPAAPATIRVRPAISNTLNLLFDFIIWFYLLAYGQVFEDRESTGSGQTLPKTASHSCSGSPERPKTQSGKLSLTITVPHNSNAEGLELKRASVDACLD